MALNRVINGNFQSADGVLLDRGWLMARLSFDCQDASTMSQIVSAIPVKIPLDQNGDVSGTVQLWVNSTLTPAGSFYIVDAFDSNGEQAWRTSQFLTIPASPSPFDLGTWVLNSPVPAGPANSSTFQTNGVNNSVQSKLNLVAGTNITLTESLGSVTIDASGGGTVAAGQNVYTTFSTIAGHATGGASPPGRTYSTTMGGRQLINTPATWKFSLSVNGGGVTLHSIVILKTLIDDFNVISSTSVTFGASSNPVLADGVHFSDSISLQLDTTHDYWIMYVVDWLSAGWVDYGPLVSSTAFGYGLAYGLAWAGNVTAVNPINPLTIFGNIGSQLNQVLAT